MPPQPTADQPARQVGGVRSPPQSPLRGAAAPGVPDTSPQGMADSGGGDGGGREGLRAGVLGGDVVGEWLWGATPEPAPAHPEQHGADGDSAGARHARAPNSAARCKHERRDGGFERHPGVTTVGGDDEWTVLPPTLTDNGDAGRKENNATCCGSMGSWCLGCLWGIFAAIRFASFSWAFPLIRTGWRRTIQEEDLINVRPGGDSATLVHGVETEFARQAQAGSRRPLFWALWKTHRVSQIKTGLFLLILEVSGLGQAVTLGWLLTAIGDPHAGIVDLYVNAAALTAVTAFRATLVNVSALAMWRGTMEVRSSAIGVLYCKILKLPYHTVSALSSGALLNVVSNDVEKFYLSWTLHSLWIGPVEMVAIGAIGWMQIGPSILVGLGIVSVLLPIQLVLGRRYSALRAQTAEQTDYRMSLLKQVVNGMRAVKLYALEDEFANHLAKSREREAKLIRSTATVQGFTFAMYFGLVTTCTCSSLIVFTVLGGTLTATNVFVTMMLFASTRLMLGYMLPTAIQNLSELRVTMARMRAVLDLSERACGTDPDADIKDAAVVTALAAAAARASALLNPTAGCGPDPTARPTTAWAPVEPLVRVDRLRCSWTPEQEAMPRCSVGVSFAIEPRSMVVVTGSVGVGKSTLLKAIAGETLVRSGAVDVWAPVLCTSQEPWIEDTSLRSNIVFGLPFRAGWYDRVIDMCELQSDIDGFALGDRSSVGECGKLLSGGQQARLALARVVYATEFANNGGACVVLLDDPFAALDNRVGAEIFRKCVEGMLLLKHCVVLVTPHRRYWRGAACVVYLEERSVVVVDGDADSAPPAGATSSESGGHQHQQHRQQHQHQQPHGHTAGGQRAAAAAAGSSDVPREPSPVQPVRSASLPPHRSRLLSVTSVDVDHVALRHTIASTGCMCEGASGMPVLHLASLSADTVARGGARAGSNDAGDGGGGDSDRDRAAGESDDAAEAEAGGGGVSDKETRESGGLHWAIIFSYFAMGGSALSRFFVVFMLMLAVVGQLGCDIYLAHWVGEAADVERSESASDEHRRNYACAVAGFVLLVYVAAVRFLWAAISAADRAHKCALAGVLGTHMRFFDTHSAGQILNRFGKDMGYLDYLLPLTAYDFLQLGTLCVAITVFAGTVLPIIMVPIAPALVLFVALRAFYIRAARDIKRIEGAARTPIYSHFAATLEGLETIHSVHGSQQRFLDQFHGYQDAHTRAWYSFVVTSRWLGSRLDMIVMVLVTTSAVAIVAYRDSIDKTQASLALAYMIQLTGLLQWCVRQSAELENQLTSVERVLEYRSLEPEAQWVACGGPGKCERHAEYDHAGWPLCGKISFHDVRMWYDSGMDLALDGVSFSVQHGQKLGVVGRSGSGKSSLVAALLRTALTSGTVVVDGVPTCAVPLKLLRRSVCVISQAPLLYEGTIMSNLDPLNLSNEWKVYKALKDVGLDGAVRLMGGLSAVVEDSGSNFSIGQRQLFCLARAIVNQTHIIVMDEATANIDTKTDAVIQSVLRRCFADATVIVVAHRLETILDSDLILVLHHGKLVEQGSPDELLADHNSSLSVMMRAKFSTAMQSAPFASADPSSLRRRKGKWPSAKAVLATSSTPPASHPVSVDDGGVVRRLSSHTDL